jgi:hypothetical protein
MAKNQNRAETHLWDEYVEEADLPDFVITDKEGEELLRVKNPSGVQLMRISQGVRSGDLAMMLLGLTGGANEAAMKLLSTAGHKALPKLVEDLMEWFGLYDEIELVGPGGGVVRESRPTKIMQLIKMGYTPKGEAPASRS